MKNKGLCPLVQDLFPSLADGITKPETEEILREHMKDCRECRELYEKICPAEIDVPENGERISVEKFVRKWKMKKLAIWMVVCVLLLGMTGITVYAMSSRRSAEYYPGVQFIKNVSLRGDGYMLGKNAESVGIAVDGALYWNTLHEDEPDVSFAWDHVSIRLNDGSFLFDNSPYGEASLHQWVPVYEDGSIRSPLVTSHMEDYRQAIFHGALYARNGMEEFILFTMDNAGDGYIVCYPSSSEEEAVQMTLDYVTEFELFETTLWHYLLEEYPDYAK